jgi:PAS domain S-box-containing protein
MADTTPTLIWMADQDGKVTYLNRRRVEFTGSDPGAGYEDTWTAFVHPDDLESVLAANTRALERRESFSKEYRLRRGDGVYRWMFDVASPRLNGDGSFAGFIGSAIDITDQKLAQEALESVGGRLIEAQEKERTRIARDLHDDICQRLALVSVGLAQATRNGASPDTRAHLEEIRQLTRLPQIGPLTEIFWFSPILTTPRTYSCRYSICEQEYVPLSQIRADLLAGSGLRKTRSLHVSWSLPARWYLI